MLHTAEITADAAEAPQAQPLASDAAQGDAHFARVLAEAGQPEEVRAPSAITGLSVTEPDRASVELSRRSAVAQPAGRLAGSILAPETWKQAAAAVRDRW